MAAETKVESPVEPITEGAIGYLQIGFRNGGLPIWGDSEGFLEGAVAVEAVLELVASKVVAARRDCMGTLHRRHVHQHPAEDVEFVGEKI